MRTKTAKTLRLTKSSPSVRYGFAFLCAMLGLAAEFAFRPVFHDLTYVMLYPICFIVIAVAGFGPACLAILINTMGAVYFFFEPMSSFLIADPYTTLKISIFALSSILIAALIEYNHRAEKKMVQSLAEMEGIEKSNERLQLAISATGIGIWEHSPSEESLYWSEELRKILGMAPDLEPNRNNWMMLIHPDDRPMLLEKIKRATDPKLREHYQAQVRTINMQNGQPQWISLHGRPYFTEDGRVKRFIGTIKDITESKSSEEALQKAKDEAESANALKSAFLANMSHEIRTPLGAILGFIDLLKEPTLSEPDRLQYLDIASRNGHQLARILNDILDISKVESGHMKCEYQWVSPQQIVEEIISLHSVKASEKGLHLRFHFDSTLPNFIATDPLRLKQVLSNVVGNAIKFTNSGWIQIKVMNFAYRKIGFEVQDTGMGIAESHRAAIFETFVQADASMSRKYEGTGLGLPLSRKIAQILGGSVVLEESQLGRGSKFLVTVENRNQLLIGQPLPSLAVVKSKDSSSSLLPLLGIRVLLVEDSKDNQQLICHYLSKTGADVKIACDGLEGYEKASQGEHDIVLMDIQMPNMDGYTATEKLREDGYRKPIIALTAHAMAEFRLRSRKAGCTDHISKPIDRNLLISTIEKYVGPQT